MDKLPIFPSEKQRLIYIAMSRPRHHLAMAFPESIDDKLIQNKFGTEIHIVKKMDN